MVEPRYFILVGDQNTWKASFTENLWGFSSRTKGLWNTINVGDYVAFYVTSPIKRVIGFGSVKDKFLDKKLFWPDEKLFKKCLWGYRFRFEITFLVDDWNQGISIPQKIMLNQGRKLVTKDFFLLLLKTADLKWNSKIRTKISNAI